MGSSGQIGLTCVFVDALKPIKMDNINYTMELGKLGHYLAELAAIEVDVHSLEGKLVLAKKRQKELIDSMGPMYYECRDAIKRNVK